MKSKAILIFLAGCLSLGIQTYAQTIPEGVYTELAKYPGLIRGLRTKAAIIYSSKLELRKRQRYTAKDITSVCQPKTTVQYMPTITNSTKFN
jgi:hypothetical protein